jgi:hypothetical protein
MSEHEINKYNNGKIYTIRCRDDNNLIYVGSTVQPLYKRWHQHKIKMNNEKNKVYNKLLYVKMRELGVDLFYIELYEDYKCERKEELTKKEGEVIRQIGILNQRIEGRTKKEYYEDKKEQIKETHKHYYKNNKQKKKDYIQQNQEKIKETYKQYYENNKEKFKEIGKQYRKENAEKIKETQKQYYENNKEKLKEYNKHHYENNKEKFKEYNKQYYILKKQQDNK